MTNYKDFLSPEHFQLLSLLRADSTYVPDEKEGLDFIISLCSTFWRCDDSENILISRYIDYAPNYYALAVFLAKRMGYNFLKVYSHEMWICSFFAQTGLENFGDNECILNAIRGGYIRINGQQPVISEKNIVEQKIEHENTFHDDGLNFEYDIDGTIILDCLVLEHKTCRYLVMAPSSHRGYVKKCLLEIAPDFKPNNND